MTYAEVAVNSPIANHQSYSYSIPPQLNIDIGHAVLVPFGTRALQGIVVTLSNQSPVKATKDIIDIISSSPLLSPEQIALGLWISQYYMASLFSSIALMLPPGFERRLISEFNLSDKNIETRTLTEAQRQIINFIQSHTVASRPELEKQFGKREFKSIIRQLINDNIIIKTDKLQGVKVKPKLVPHVRLAVPPDEIPHHIERLQKDRAHSQAKLLYLLSQKSTRLPLSALKAYSRTAIESLKKKNLICVDKVEIRRDPLALLHLETASIAAELTTAQQEALTTITEQKSGLRPPVFLLHGVTGSGKTEVYIRALAEVISRGGKGICLVPEIALTPQTIERFAIHFPGRIAILHSKLSLGEQYDEWHRIKRGECDVVIGTRSALFSPQPNLGLIIIDEEHEWTYKQTEQSPRYHAREAAIKLASLMGAAVILGSATPDIESYYKATTGQYKLIDLKERITPRGITPLPEVKVINMGNELKNGNMSLFSRSLIKAMQDALSNNNQIVLFLNRRGTAHYIQCRKCGFVPTCSQCLVALNYHSAEDRLICHHCRKAYKMIQNCPKCGVKSLKLSGIGTQKVEEEVKHLFHGASVIRLDSDITSISKNDDVILNKFRKHDADILVGTQMIAKRLDFPDVTLTGVINADTGLNLSDFRASEKTFQLLSQVAGRAGRGLPAGNVIIQTYNPNHYAIKAVSTHDYIAFYRQELEYRKQFRYPPFSRMARLIFSHSNAEICRREVEKVNKLIIAERDKQELQDNKIIGPIPSLIPKAKGKYVWQLILSGTSINALLPNIPLAQGWIIDIDPITML